MSETARLNDRQLQVIRYGMVSIIDNELYSRYHNALRRTDPKVIESVAITAFGAHHTPEYVAKAYEEAVQANLPIAFGTRELFGITSVHMFKVDNTTGQPVNITNLMVGSLAATATRTNEPFEGSDIGYAASRIRAQSVGGFTYSLPWTTTESTSGPVTLNLLSGSSADPR